jgi:hypothetical protein
MSRNATIVTAALWAILWGAAPAMADDAAAPPAEAAEAAAAPEATPETLTLDEAVRQGKVEVHVSSLGGALGTKIQVDVRSRVGHVVHVEVAPGTVFLSTSDKVQNLTGGPVRAEVVVGGTRSTSVMVLVDNRRRSYLVESYCLDYHKPAPTRGQKLELALMDQRAVRILHAPPGARPSPWAFQCAIWIDRAGVSEAELKRRYRLSDADLQEARRLLVHAERVGVASIPPGLPADVRVHVERLYKPDPAARAQAVAALGRMGSRALPAVPLVQVNVDIDAPGRWSPTAPPPVPATPQEAVAMLRQLDLPMLQPLIEGLSVRVAVEAVPGVPPVPGLVPGGVLPEGLAPGGGILADRFIANLKSPVVGMRRRAATMLGLSHQPRVVEPLIEALEDDDAQVREAAAGSLRRLTGQEFGADQAKWSQWWEENKETFQPAATP